MGFQKLSARLTKEVEMKKILCCAVVGLVALAFVPGEPEAREPSYIGYKKCGGCHKSQRNSWLDTEHAEAYEVLMPGEAVEAKKKADLDPDKDYTNDKDCLPCHVTGYGKKGGYEEGMSETKKRYFKGVTCEECHGPGSLYRRDHSKAGKLYRKRERTTARKVLVRHGEVFDYEEQCATCHLNYKGSPWKKASPPYTPFTPEVDPEYEFDYEKAVRETGAGKGMHEHFKLQGIFTGEPIPDIREEFQKDAPWPAAEDEEEDMDDEDEE